MEGEKVEKELKSVSDLIAIRSDGGITIEATVDTGFEFMAVNECRKKFGSDLPVLKERGRIVFNVDKSLYSEVLQMRSVDNLSLVISYTESIGLKGDTAEDLVITKNQAHVPEWDHWLPVWCELVGFKGITKPTLEQYEAANTRAKEDKKREKERQAERQKNHKERQQRQAMFRAQRQARADQRRAERQGVVSDSSGDNKQILSHDNTETSSVLTESVHQNDLEVVEIKAVHENLTADGENLSTGTDFFSADSENPSIDGENPSIDGENPSADGENPSADGENPSADGENPSADGENPSADGENPSADGENPSADGENPSADGEKPSADGEILSADGEHPSVNGENLQLTESKPGVSVEIESEKKSEDEPTYPDNSENVEEVGEESNLHVTPNIPPSAPEGVNESDNSSADKDSVVTILEADPNCDDRAEVESLPDYERSTERGEVDGDIPPDERVMRFRATCYRTGKHSFGSTEAACEFGGELQSKFNWVVDLTNFHSEIVLTLHKETSQVGIALTKQSLHKRNISFFGPTTLRATTCHNLLRMADIKPGDVVLDPMAGGGSIPIEGALSFPGVFMIGGDNHRIAIDRAYSNVRSLQNSLCHSLPLDTLRWDARHLPMREASVDAIVSDMPFGVRMGSKSSNRGLYAKVLCEMARVTRPGTGRAILLTQDRKSFALALCQTFGLWWQSHVLSANIGGLDAAVFTLRRTSKLRPEEAEFAKGVEKEKGSWRGGPSSGGARGRRGQSWGRGRGQSYPRSSRQGSGSNSSGNWRDRSQKNKGHDGLPKEKEAS